MEEKSNLYSGRRSRHKSGCFLRGRWCCLGGCRSRCRILEIQWLTFYCMKQLKKLKWIEYWLTLTLLNLRYLFSSFAPDFASAVCDKLIFLAPRLVSPRPGRQTRQG